MHIGFGMVTQPPPITGFRGKNNDTRFEYRKHILLCDLYKLLYITEANQNKATCIINDSSSLPCDRTNLRFAVLSPATDSETQHMLSLNLHV